MRVLILFLIRKKLGVRKREYFQFVNQKNSKIHYFTDTAIMKIDADGVPRISDIGLNWLLDEECKTIKL